MVLPMPIKLGKSPGIYFKMDETYHKNRGVFLVCHFQRKNNMADNANNKIPHNSLLSRIKYSKIFTQFSIFPRIMPESLLSGG